MKHTVEEIELNNGAKGLLINVPSAPVMTYSFSFRAGYFTAPDKKWDVPHILEHMMFGANDRFSRARAYGAEFEKNGAFHNATTGKWFINYDSECAAFEWDRVLELQILALARPVFLEEEFRAEKGNVYEELTGFFNNYFRVLGGQLGQLANLDIFTDEQRVAQLASIEMDDVQKFYRKTHSTDNLRFVIAGPIYGKKTKLVKILNDGLKPMRRGELFELPKESPGLVEKALYIERTDVQKMHFYLDMYVHKRLTDKQNDAMGLLNNILTGTLHSRILGAAREEGIVYAMGSGTSRARINTSWWFGANVNNQNAPQLIELIKSELFRIADGSVDKADIEAAKQLSIGKFQRGSQKVADHVAGYRTPYLYDGSIDKYSETPDIIKAIRKSTIVDTAQDIINEKTWGFGVLGNASQELADELHRPLAELFTKVR